MTKSMTSKEFNNYVMKGIGIVVVFIILAVATMSFLGNERRKKVVNSLQRQLKEKFDNHGPAYSNTNSNSNSKEQLNNILLQLQNLNKP
tara:strand:+ start:293 stop:559 length:267 start_codon:yes stop_codon:yes gene_type:complete